MCGRCLLRGKGGDEVLQERLKLRLEKNEDKVGCWRCRSSSRMAGSVLAFDVGADLALEEALVSVNFG